MRFCTAEESRLKKLLELQTTKICAERMRKRDDAWAHEGGGVERGESTDNKRIWALAGKRPYKWNVVLNLFSTELPFTRGSFTASVRDHNLREASHLYYEGKE